MQVHLTAASIALQDNQTQSSRESLSVHEFRASNSTVFQMVSFKWKHIWSKSRRVEAHTRLVRLHAAPQRPSAAWQKQCILVRTFVRLWSALQPPYSHMWHQSTARAKRDQQPRSGAAGAQNRLRKPWWRHTLFSLVRFCDDKHEVCWVFILTINTITINTNTINKPILLTNLYFYDSKSLFSVHRTSYLEYFFYQKHW